MAGAGVHWHCRELLAFDLSVLHRDTHEIDVRESLMLSAFCINIGLAFGGWVWHLRGQEDSVFCWTGFVIEKSLAMDNVFVISTTFAYFGIRRALPHRVLRYGILGVILLRGIMIAAGASIVDQYAGVLYIFAAFLIFTGIKMLSAGHGEYDVASSPVLKFVRKRVRVTDTLHGPRFFVREADSKTAKIVTAATPLFLALVMVEFAGVISAVDPIPAVFAITTDPFLV